MLTRAEKTQWKFESIETTSLQAGQRGRKPNGTKAILALDTMGMALRVAALSTEIAAVTELRPLGNVVAANS